MRVELLKAFAVAAFVTSLVYAIGNTANDSTWLSVWFSLFFFVGLPLALLSLRDVLVAIFSGRSDSFRAWLLLHVCAFFAAGVGLLLGYMAKSSDHPKAESHQWLALVLPALVYAAPVLLALQSRNTSFLSVLAKAFRRAPRDGP